MPPFSTLPREQPSNLLPLEEWRYLMGYHPYHFWQLANERTPISSNCDQTVYEYNWQDADSAGRTELRGAILEAQDKMAQYLGYAIAPHYKVETHRFPRYPDQRFDRLGYAAGDARWETLQLSEGHLQAVGAETLTLISTPEVVYSDRDGDGLTDTFTLTVSTDLTNPDEIAVYFTAEDRLDEQPAGERWRIQPVQVTIAGGVATVIGRAWLLVRPVRYEGIEPQALDPDEVTNFASHLDVYRRYTSAGTAFDTAQAVLVWETRPWPEWTLVGAAEPTASTDAAGEAYALARCGIRDAAKGIITLAESVYDPVSGEWALARNYGYWCRPPDRVIVRYLAGYPLEQGRVAQRWREPLAALSAADMVRPICACQAANRKLYEWQFDLSRAQGVNDEQYATSQDVLSNPFGTRRGHVRAWRMVEDNLLPRGFVA